MRIGIDIRALMDLRYSGVSEYVMNLVNEILKQDKNNQYILFYNSFKDIKSRLPEFGGDNVKLIGWRYPNKIFNYFLQKILKWPKIDRKLGVDLFFMPHINFASLSSDCKSIITIHDLSYLRYPEFFSTRKNVWHRMINVKKLIKKFDKIVSVSENTKNDIAVLCRIDELKVKVISSAISENCKRVDNINELTLVKNIYNLPGEFILYLGTIEPRKNIENLIEAYNLFKKRTDSNVKLVIAGSKGWKYKYIFELISKSQYSQDIIVLGYVEDAHKPALYTLSKLLVYPSFYEGFGFPPLEAMFCGTPVIASYSSSLPEVCADAALLVNPYNPNDISSALEELMSNNDLREKLIKKGLARASSYSWANTAKKYIELFNSFGG